MSESELMVRIQETLNTMRGPDGKYVARLARNAVGFFDGNKVTVAIRALERGDVALALSALKSIKSPRSITYGLGTGSADLVGVLRSGRVLGCEVKTPTGKVSKEQQAWIDSVNRWGGVAFVARSTDEAVCEVLRAIKEESDRATGT